MKKFAIAMLLTVTAAVTVFFCPLPKSVKADAVLSITFKGEKGSVYYDYQGEMPYAELVALSEEIAELGFSAQEVLYYVLPDLEAKIVDVRKLYETPCVNADLSFINNNGYASFTVSEDKVGSEIEADKLFSLIFVKMKSSNRFTVKVPIKTVEPIVSRAMLAAETHEKGGFTTWCSTENTSRCHNIALAARALDCKVIPKGRILSFNDIVGRRTEQRGYRNAGVIYNGRFSEGVGGGVCQLSTTLYNAAILADLEIVERRRHTLLSTYVEAGFDAMVSDGADLRIKNNTDGNIYVIADYRDGRVTVRLYGTENKYEVQRISKIVEDYGDNSLYSESYAAYLQNGIEVKRKLLHRDFYYPIK